MTNNNDQEYINQDRLDYFDKENNDIWRNVKHDLYGTNHNVNNKDNEDDEMGMGRQLVEGVLNLLSHSDSSSSSDEDDNRSSVSSGSNFSFSVNNSNSNRKKRSDQLSVKSYSSSIQSHRRSLSILKNKKVKRKSRRSKLRQADITQDFILITINNDDDNKPSIKRYNNLNSLMPSIKNNCGNDDDKNDDKVWWLDVKSPTWDDMRSLCSVFPLHPLTQEDILQQDTREKFETFHRLGYTLIVFRGVDERYFRLSDPLSGASRKADDVSLEHLSPDIHLNDHTHDQHYTFKKRMRIVEGVGGKEGVEGVGVGGINLYLLIFKNGVISFHFDNIATHTDKIIRRMFTESNNLSSFLTPEWIAHGLLDSLVDAFLPLIEYVERETDEIDDLVVDPRGLSKSTYNDRSQNYNRNGDTNDYEKDIEVERPSEDTYNYEKGHNNYSPDSLAYSKKFELPPPLTTPQQKNFKSKMGPLTPLFDNIMDSNQLFEWRKNRKAKRNKRKYSVDDQNIKIEVPQINIKDDNNIDKHEKEGYLMKLLKFVKLKSNHNDKDDNKLYIPEEIRYLSQSSHSQSHLLKRTTDTRRLVTGLNRLLGSKADVIRQFRSRMVESRKKSLVNNPKRSEILREMIVHFGDVEDHIISSTQTLMHDERVISSLHLAYLAQLKLGHAVSKSGSDNTILALSVITVCSLPMMVITQAFSMNVIVPHNGVPEDPDDNGPPMVGEVEGTDPPYNAFGIIVLGLCCVFVFVGFLVRYWILQARKEGMQRRRRRIGE